MAIAARYATPPFAGTPRNAPVLGMNRFLAAVAPLAWLLLCAQIPYEYFEIKEITPPAVSYRQPRPNRSAPEELTIDNQTQVAGNLTLSEPFAPPVGVYKRVSVFSDIVYRNGDFYIVPDDSQCIIVRPSPVESPALPMHRSVLVFLELSDVPVSIPSDSPEMRITKLSVHPASSPSSALPQITITQCRNQNYQITSSIPGLYKIEYETISPSDAATPKNADFFASIKPASSGLPQEIVNKIDDLVAQSEELQAIRISQFPLSKLIRFFQSFDSDYLSTTESQDHPQTSEAILKAILKEKKGVCRHRAILFMLIARAWGYPVRIAANEIHAFIEIQLNNRWYPVEMGGVANSLTIEPTNPALSSTVQNQFSFASFPQSASSFDLTQIPDQQTSSVSASAQGKVTGRPAHLSLEHQHQMQLHLVPSHKLPATIRRDSVTELSGQVLAPNGTPMANSDIELEIVNLYHRKIIVLPAHTDDNGFVKIQLKLPPDWPVGQTNIQWRAVK